MLYYVYGENLELFGNHKFGDLKTSWDMFVMNVKDLFYTQILLSTTIEQIV